MESLSASSNRGCLRMWFGQVKEVEEGQTPFDFNGLDGDNIRLAITAPLAGIR